MTGYNKDLVEDRYGPPDDTLLVNRIAVHPESPAPVYHLLYRSDPDLYQTDRRGRRLICQRRNTSNMSVYAASKAPIHGCRICRDCCRRKSQIIDHFRDDVPVDYVTPVERLVGDDGLSLDTGGEQADE